VTAEVLADEGHTIASDQVPPEVHSSRRVAVLAGVLGVALIIVAHSRLGQLDMTRAVSLLTLVAMASAWNLVGGYGGLFSIGHAMFVGTGSYATAMLMVHHDLSVWWVLAMSGVVAGGLGFLVALPMMRLRAAYFSVASLGIALAAQAWMTNWDWTGASTGVQLPLSKFIQPADQYWLAATLAVATVAITVAVVRSGVGLRLMALRDDEEAAAEVGVRRTPVVLVVWTISAALTGIGGGLVAIQKGTVEPISAFSFTFTLDMILAAVIGGLGTITGPIIGAVALYVLRQYLVDWRDWASVALGCVIVVVIRFAPGGLWGVATRLWSLAPRRGARPPDQSEADATPSEPNPLPPKPLGADT